MAFVPFNGPTQEQLNIASSPKPAPDNRGFFEKTRDDLVKSVTDWWVNGTGGVPDAGIGDSPHHMPDGTVEQPQGRLYTDAAQAVGDWGQGAAQGLAEIGRRQGEASQYSMTDDSGMTYLKPGATMDNAVYADDMTNQAKGTFLRETVKPVAMPLALVGGPVGAVAGAATVPFMAEDAVHSYEKGGVGQVARDFTYGGVVDAFAQPDLAERLGQNPARTVADVGMAALPVALMAKGAYKGGASVHDTINRIFDEKLGELGETRPFAAINGLDALDQVDSPTRGFRPATPEEAKQWNLDQQYAPLFDQLPPEPATSKLSLDPIAIKNDIVSAVTADYNRRMGIEQSVSPMKFSDGYRVESNKLLHEAEPHEIVLKPDGSPFFGEISHEVASQIDPSYGVIPGKILMQVGRDSNGQGAGLIHMKKRESSFQKAGFAGAEDFINDTLQNFNEIRENQKGRLLLIKRGSPNQLSSIELQPIDYNGNRYYSVITSMPVREKGASYFTKNKLLYERSPSLSPESDVGSASWNPPQKVGEMDQGGNAKSSFVNNIQQPKELFNGKEYSLASKSPNIEAMSREDAAMKAKQAAFDGDHDAAMQYAQLSGDKSVIHLVEASKIFDAQLEAKGIHIPQSPRLLGKPKGEYKGNTITMRDLLAEAEKLFVPIRTGRVVPGADGQYSHKSGNIRTGTYGDINTALHEIGHVVDASLGLRKEGAYDAEFVRAVHSRFGEEAYKPEQVRGEGIAEFFRHYISDKNVAKEMFPKYYDAFETALHGNTDIAARVSRLSDMVKVWYSQSPEARARSGLHFANDRTSSSFKEKVAKAWTSFQEKAIDRRVALRKEEKKYESLTGEKISTEDSPYLAAKVQKGLSGGSAKCYTESETPSLAIKALNKAWGDGVFVHEVTMKSIMKKLNGIKISPETLKSFNMKDVYQYASTFTVAQRSLELKKLYGPDYKTPMGIEEAIHMVKTAPREVFEFANAIYDYSQNLVNLMERVGMLSTEAVAGMEKHKNYVPFQRVFDNVDDFMGAMGGKGGYGNVASPVKRLSEGGSTREVIDPLESLYKNTYLIFDAVGRNEVGKKVADLSNVTGSGRIIEEVSGRANSLDNTFSVWRNGEKTTYQTDPDLYRAVMTLQPGQMGAVTKFASYFARALRAGATLTVDFVLKNVIRDPQSALLYSKHTYIPFVDQAKGLASFLRKDQDFHDYMVSGAMMSDLVGMDRSYAYKNVRSLWKKSFADRVNILRYLQNFSEAAEIATRHGNFIKDRKSGLSLLESGINSRDLTLDFEQGGSTAMEVNKVASFFNAQIQDPVRAWKGFKDNPGKMSLRVGLYLVAPSMYFWAINHDQEWYKEMPSYQRDLFWLVKSPWPGYSNIAFGDDVLRIPKNFGTGMIFASGTERMLDYLSSKDPEGLKKWFKTTIQGMTPNALPTLLTPVIGNLANYDMFTERDIVPKREAGLQKDLQYGTNTSSLAKKIGETFNLSPRKVDHTIYSIGGGLARQTLNIFDSAIGEREFSNPLKQAFFVDPSKNPQSIQDYYDKKEELEIVMNSHKKRGTKPTREENGNYQEIVKSNKIMEDFNKQERDIIQSKTLTQAEKDAKLKLVNAKQLGLAKAVLARIK